jgi:predicted  nucleic acid-binding Zn-ribbon protein
MTALIGGGMNSEQATPDKLLDFLRGELKTIAKELQVINDELGEVEVNTATMRTDIEWLKKGLTKLQRELWAVLSVIVGTALLYWFLQ